MKSFILSFIGSLIAVAMLSACDHTEEPNVIHSTNTNTTRAEENQSDEDFFSSSVANRIQIATWFANNYTLKDAQRIHNSVLKARSMGLDEIYYLIEYASVTTSSNKISIEEPTQTSMKFRNEVFNVSSTGESGYSTQTIQTPLDLFNHERLEIYWPYSNNWDGITTPVVAFAPKNLSALRTEGFILKNGYLQSVIVDEHYCENHPVWLITENETPYSHLPNFTNGETVSQDGVLYLPNTDILINSDNLNGVKPPSPYPFPTDSIKVTNKGPVTTLYLGHVRSEKNHDTWIAGGSEYVFRFVSLTNTNLSCEADTSKCMPDLARTKVCFTRDEIKYKTQKELRAIAVSSWPKTLDNIVMTLVEEDWGNKEKTYEGSIFVTWAGQKYGIEVSIPYYNHDDQIAERTYARSFLISSNNYKGLDENGKEIWYEDNSDGVYWTLPYEVGWEFEHEVGTP